MFVTQVTKESKRSRSSFVKQQEKKNYKAFVLEICYCVLEEVVFIRFRITVLVVIPSSLLARSLAS